MKILLVDDDPRLRDLVRLALERAGYSVITAADGQHAPTHAAREAPDLIVLDVGLPELDGFEVCRRIRAHSQVPILFLTARDDEVDKIVGLELGADDYVTKPFSPRELTARIKAILKRSGRLLAVETTKHADITLNRAAHACRVENTEVALTATEFALLSHLMAAPARLHPRAALIEALWGARSPVSDRTLDSHLRNLRQKLATAGCADAFESVHGVGIRLRAGR
jgi:two-component system OmpR family response regulator